MTATSEAGATALETRELRVEFGIRGGGVARAVDGVNLAVRRGEIIALVGESGSGKTTLARTILGLQRPTSGAVYVAGEALSYRSRALKAYRRRAQLILQDPSGALNPRHTVFEAVAEGLRVHGLHDAQLGRRIGIDENIIESHGGEITVDLNPGGGTIFRFTLRGVVPEELVDAQ